MLNSEVEIDGYFRYLGGKLYMNILFTIFYNSMYTFRQEVYEFHGIEQKFWIQLPIFRSQLYLLLE